MRIAVSLKPAGEGDAWHGGFVSIRRADRCLAEVQAIDIAEKIGTNQFQSAVRIAVSLKTTSAAPSVGAMSFQSAVRIAVSLKYSAISLSAYVRCSFNPPCGSLSR